MSYGHAKNPKAPCYGCKDRYVDGDKTCHSTCEKYKKYHYDLIEDNKVIHKHINPPGSRYFKTKKSGMAPKSKAKYR